MSNGKVMIVHLIAGLIKKIWCDFIGCNSIVYISNIFLNHINHSVEILTLKLVFQIMQQNQELKIFHMLIL